MAGLVAALDFLGRKRKPKIPPVVVSAGKDHFLVRLVREHVRAAVIDEEEGEFSVTTFVGDDAAMCDVVDELRTVALFGGPQRLVIVEDATAFITQNRASLESYVAQPAQHGVLLLETTTWPGNTRLAKLVDQDQLAIQCGEPKPERLARWLPERAAAVYGAKLSAGAAGLMVELVGANTGVLDQELGKLVAFAGADDEIDTGMVEKLVGTQRGQDVWQMLNSALAGDADSALAQLDALLLAPTENPIAVLGRVAFSLRHLAVATRLFEQHEAEGARPRLGDVLLEAGMKPFAVRRAEPQLRRLGRERAARLLDEILAADLAMKGGSQLPPRTVLESLILRLCQAKPTGRAAEPAH